MKVPFFSSRFSQIAALILLLGLGFAIRLYDLTDLPLDFHPTRQLLSALKTRGMYYQTLPDAPADQRDFAIQQWKALGQIILLTIAGVINIADALTKALAWML